MDTAISNIAIVDKLHGVFEQPSSCQPVSWLFRQWSDADSNSLEGQVWY
jgi:hypothetical protein